MTIVKFRNSVYIGMVLLVFLMADLALSFYQHYHMSLGGDMSHVILPTPETGYYQVLQDPLGLGVLCRDEVYSNPNKFFAQWSAAAYFRSMPFLLQKFMDAISSVYLSTAIFKTLVQLLILYLLAVSISNRKNIFSLDFLVAAALLAPLFQASGYNRFMGIIDQSVIFSFFYALPAGLLLLFFLPYFRELFYGKKRFGVLKEILLALAIPVIALSGPLLPGIVLIVCPMVLFYLYRENYRHLDAESFRVRALKSLTQIPGHILFWFSLISLFCLYSLYIGKNNAMNIQESIPLAERYLRLPEGLYFVLTSKLGFPLLFLAIAVNTFLMHKRYRTVESEKLLRLMKWTGIFSLLYILLLPMGGYRMYREYIIRYDTFLPVTIGIFFTFGAGTLYILKNMGGPFRLLYISGIVVLLLVFINSDRPDTRNYDCERDALETIARSQEKVVELDHDCFILDWRILHDPARRELDGDLLYFWNITDEKKLFYQAER